jgi:penicillin-binding protein 1A
MCGPVFSDFMRVALKGKGPAEYEQPEDSVFIKIDRFTGERLSADATGDHVVMELFRLGTEPSFGVVDPRRVIDGGFKMGSDLKLYTNPRAAKKTKEVTVTTSSGKKVKKKLPSKASFGSISSGGLY